MSDMSAVVLFQAPWYIPAYISKSENTGLQTGCARLWIPQAEETSIPNVEPRSLSFLSGTWSPNTELCPVQLCLGVFAWFLHGFCMVFAIVSEAGLPTMVEAETLKNEVEHCVATA